MPINSPKIALNFMIGCLIIVIFCGLLYIPSSLGRSLHYQDELRYTEVAREMYVNGNWWILNYGGLPYTQKPPLYFWLLNFSRMVFRSYSTIAMVLPSVIAAIILVLLVFKFSTAFMDLKYALLSGFILATTGLFYGLAIFVRMDMLMSLFITCSLWSFYRGYHEQNEKIKAKYYMLIYLFTTAAVLVKGPYGLLMPLTVIPVFLIANRDFKEFKKLKLIPGFGLLASVFLLWVGIVFISGGRDYAYQLFVVQTLGRAKDSFAHAQPFYYYFQYFPLVLLPWTFFLLSYFVGLVKNRHYSKESTFLLSWLLAPLFLFSCFSGKLAIYLLPIIPPAAILVGYLIREVLEGKFNLRYFVIPAMLTLLVLLGMVFTLGKVNILSHFSYLILSLMVIVIAIICIIGLWQKRVIMVTYLLVSAMSCVLISFSWVALPRLNQSYTREPIGYKLKSLKNQGLTNIISYRYSDVHSLAVYTNFFIDNINEETKLVQYLKEHKETVLLISEKNWDQIKRIIPGRIKTIINSKDYLRDSTFTTQFMVIVDLKNDHNLTVSSGYPENLSPTVHTKQYK